MSKQRRKRWRIGEGKSNVEQHTAEQAGNFLFDVGIAPHKKKDKQKWESGSLDMRTRVMGPHIMSALMYYDILHLGFESESARIVGDTIKRLLIGHEGMGREEARAILMQSLPHEIEIETGNLE